MKPQNFKIKITDNSIKLENRIREKLENNNKKNSIDCLDNEQKK